MPNLKFVSLTNLVRFLENLKDMFVHQVPGKGLSTNDLTDTLKADYDAAYTHSQADHCPADAEENVIASIKVNGKALDIEDKTVDITVPTKISDLENDGDFLQPHPEVEVDDDTTNTGAPTYGGTIDVVDDVVRDEFGHVININTKKVTLPDRYEHPESDVVPGVYRSVTVDKDGHITEGSNPTTKAGYGITDVPTIEDMEDAITVAMGQSGHLKKAIVLELPDVSEADEDIIYLVKNDSEEDDNIYTEWMLIDGDWEKMGDTALIDLDQYLHEDDLEAITNGEIDALFDVA